MHTPPLAQPPCPAPQRWPGLGRLAWAALLGTLLGLLTACAGLPPRGPAEVSTSLTDTANTPLAQLAAKSLAAARPPGQAPSPPPGAGPITTPPLADGDARSAFRMLPTGEYAFGARIGLAQLAQRTVDVQVYHLHPDQAGRVLLRELRDAAARGVRVRLLVDDFHAAEAEPLLRGLAAHPGVQVRLFNPLPVRHGAPLLRLLMSAGDFEQHNRRMHNKLMLADHAVALFGGRNVADEYFMGHAEANFIDMDALAVGAVVADLAAAFDRYWNSESAWPLQAVPAASTDDPTAARAGFDAEVRHASTPMAPYTTDPLGQGPVQAQLQAGQLLMTRGRAQVFADPPAKVTGASLTEPTAAMGGMLGILAQARRQVLITSPYFVPGHVGMPMMRRAAQYGVQTVLMTNSLASTDEPLVHARYSDYRREMLQIGVDIREFNPVQIRGMQGFGNFGRSTPRLHAKVAVVDGRWLLMGSVNLDARSAVANTEMSVVIDSPALAGQLQQLMSGERLGGLARLRLQPDGQTIEWVTTGADGQPQASTDEPGSGAWLRFKLWLQGLVVPERLL